MDFNPQMTILEVPQWTGQCKRETFFPAVGSKIAAIYIEASENATEVNNLLAQIEVLSDTFKKFIWTPSAEPGREPSVNVRVIVSTDA